MDLPFLSYQRFRNAQTSKWEGSPQSAERELGLTASQGVFINSDLPVVNLERWCPLGSDLFFLPLIQRHTVVNFKCMCIYK